MHDNIISIERSAFKNCKNLEEVVLSKSIKEINYNVFDGCEKLKK